MTRLTIVFLLLALLFGSSTALLGEAVIVPILFLNTLLGSSYMDFIMASVIGKATSMSTQAVLAQVPLSPSSVIETFGKPALDSLKSLRVGNVPLLNSWPVVPELPSSVIDTYGKPVLHTLKSLTEENVPLSKPWPVVSELPLSVIDTYGKPVQSSLKSLKEGNVALPNSWSEMPESLSNGIETYANPVLDSLKPLKDGNVEEYVQNLSGLLKIRKKSKRGVSQSKRQRSKRSSDHRRANKQTDIKGEADGGPPWDKRFQQHILEDVNDIAYRLVSELGVELGLNRSTVENVLNGGDGAPNLSDIIDSITKHYQSNSAKGILKSMGTFLSGLHLTGKGPLIVSSEETDYENDSAPYPCLLPAIPNASSENPCVD